MKSRQTQIESGTYKDIPAVILSNGVLKATVHFSHIDLPAFCVWVNEGWFHGFRNIALEPCSAPFDRVDIAGLHGKSSTLGAYEKRQ